MLDKISVIVPVFNAEEYLQQCLDSLVNQTYKNIEILCINDGSTDDSKSILERYAKEYNNITAINQKNKGVSAARNLGLEKATGDWIMFVDADDWVEINICEILLQEAQKEHVQIVMCTYSKEYRNRYEVVHAFDKSFVLRDGVRYVHRRIYGPINEETASPAKLDVLVSPWMQLFRRDTVEGVVFPDIRKYGTFEDGLFQIDVYSKCSTFSYIDIPLYHYRKTNNQSITTHYKPELAKKHAALYRELEKQIIDRGYDKEYIEGLNNRIIMGLIGLSMNEAHANDGIWKKAARLRKLVSSKRYKRAFKSFDTSYMSFPWRIFFALLKHQQTHIVALAFSMVVRLKETNWILSN